MCCGESFHAMGYTIELHVYPWKRALTLVKTGMLDVLFPTGFSEERAEYFEYSKEEINRADFLIYVREDSDFEWSGLESLEGRTIGALRGWNYGTKWSSLSSFKKHEINDILQGFAMLDKKRLEGLAGYELNFDYALKKAEWQNTYKKLPVFDSTKEYAAGAKSNSNVIQVIKDFDAGKKQIMENGIFDKITDKWQGRK